MLDVIIECVSHALWLIAAMWTAFVWGLAWWLHLHPGSRLITALTAVTLAGWVGSVLWLDLSVFAAAEMACWLTQLVGAVVGLTMALAWMLDALDIHGPKHGEKHGRSHAHHG